MTKYARILFWVIEINFWLWLVVFGSVISLDGAKDAQMLQYHKYFCITGVAVAVVLQHWSYYKIYKPSKEKKKQNVKSEAEGVEVPSSQQIKRRYNF